MAEMPEKTQNQPSDDEKKSTLPREAKKPTPHRTSSFIRAESEDDDGYDPYSDRRYEPPLFERDPWN